MQENLLGGGGGGGGGDLYITCTHLDITLNSSGTILGEGGNSSWGAGVPHRKKRSSSQIIGRKG